MKKFIKLPLLVTIVALSLVACDPAKPTQNETQKTDSLQNVPDKTAADTTLKTDTVKKDTIKK